MKVKVSKNRQVFGGSLKVGITNENNYEVLEFTFPSELENYIKYIEIEAENEEGKLEYVDRIEDNKFTLSNRLTKYSELNMEVSCRDLNGIVFKSEIFTVTIGQALNILEDLVEEQEDLFERVERELQEVYQGMEEFKTEIVEDANSRFNTNVTEKTQGFNTNATNKTTDFNDNYDEKLANFNTNATTKLEQYNSNDTAKTQTYNTNATEKLNTYNTNATSKLAEYNSNAETKLNTYNTNATQKLAEYDSRVADLHEDLDETQAKVDQYNTNIDIKYTQYNNNAEQKLSAYNQNATTKTNSYNTNAQTKLEAYNTNATAKTTAYNENAEEKIEEYNDNASELIESVETLEQKHDTEVAELNEKITELETDLEMATDLIPTAPATGSDITINDSARYYFKKVEIEGKSEQDGEPSSTNEVPIQNVTGEVEVKVKNKNLCNSISNGYYRIEDGKIVNDNKYRTFVSEDLQSGDYMFSTNLKNCVILRIWYDSSTHYITSIPQNSYQFSTTTTGKVMISVRNASSTEITEDVWGQIEEGNTVSNYIAHEEQTVTFPLAEGQVLHESDTIEDKIVQKRETLVLNGTENWRIYETISNTFTLPITNIVRDVGLCSHFKIITSGLESNDYACLINASGAFIKDIDYSTLTEFKTWLAQQYANDTPVTIEYELETPIEIPFTEAQRTAKTQIDKLYSYKGTTHITSNANLDVTYRKDPNLAEEQQNSKLEELEARIELLEG